MKNLVVKLSLVFIALFCGVFLFQNVVKAAVPSEGLVYCHGPQDFDTYYDEDNICYSVKAGDTLWGIAKFYLGSGLKFSDLEISYEYRKKQNALTYISNPKLLQVGSKINFNTSQLEPYGGYDSVDGPALVHPETGKLITWSRNRDGKGLLNAGNEIYAGPYAFVKHLRASKDGKNISYLAKQEGVCLQQGEGYQFFVNGQPNECCITGNDFKLLTYSPDGLQYAVRNNIGSDPEKFLILSSIGNSEKYDFLDSLFWADNERLVYRAQINDEWRIVVNNKDYLVYDYLENLAIKDNIIAFDARDNNQNWTHETVMLTDKENKKVKK